MVELHKVAGHYPKLKIEYFEDLFRRIKETRGRISGLRWSHSWPTTCSGMSASFFLAGFASAMTLEMTLAAKHFPHFLVRECPVLSPNSAERLDPAGSFPLNEQLPNLRTNQTFTTWARVT